VEELGRAIPVLTWPGDDSSTIHRPYYDNYLYLLEKSRAGENS
jgi:hypothetical protein